MRKRNISCLCHLAHGLATMLTEPSHFAFRIINNPTEPQRMTQYSLHKTWDLIGHLLCRMFLATNFSGCLVFSAPCCALTLSAKKDKVKCTLVQALRLCTGCTAYTGSRGIGLHFHGHSTRGGEGSVSRPSRSLPPGKSRYPLYRRLGGPQGRSGQVWKISPPHQDLIPRMPSL